MTFSLEELVVRNLSKGQSIDCVFDKPSFKTFMVDGLKIDVFYHIRSDSNKVVFLGQSVLSKVNREKGLPFFFRNTQN